MRLRGLVVCIGLLFVTLFSLQPAHAQFRQQGSKLVGSGSLGVPQQGYSVALSRDGNTAIVGGMADNDQIGAAWVWTRNGGVWTQQQKLASGDSAGHEAQGYSVSLSSDGNTALVGEPQDNSNSGAAWVWTRNGGVWTPQAKLFGAGSVAGFQGASVSLSADGNTVIIGGPDDNQGMGAAWVFTRNGGSWTQQGSKLVSSDEAASLAGVSVSISGDGNTAIIGGYNDNFATGAAWVWVRSGGVWTQQSSKLVGSGTVGRTAQGRSVSLSADGNTAIVGGFLDNAGTGAAWVWTRSGGFWSQQTKLTASGTAGVEDQGWAVSISGDGNSAIIGGPADNNSQGAAWIWKRSGSLWTQSDKLVGSGAVGNALQGFSVGLSADGTTAIVGGYQDAANTGAAWIFAPAVQKRRAVLH